MAEKKLVLETEVIDLPLMYLVVGDVSVPDPDRRHIIIQKQKKLDPGMEVIVKRLIAYLKGDE